MRTSSRSRSTAANGSPVSGARSGSAARIAPGSTRESTGRSRTPSRYSASHSSAAAPSSRRLIRACSPAPARDLAPRARVEDLLLRKPRPAGLGDAELGVRERPDRVRIGGDRDEDPGFPGKPRVDVAHVEAVWLTVDLERGAGLDRALDDALDVDVGSGAAVQLPARQVPDAVDVGMVERGEDPLRRALVEGGVERG